MQISELTPGRLDWVVTVGADLDLTLIDTRTATAVALGMVNTELGEAIDVERFVANLGMPLREELARWVAPERMELVVKTYREAFLSEGIGYLRPLPGAMALTRAQDQAGRRLVVITSRLARIAESCMAACGLTVTTVVGGVAGVEKAEPMRDLGVEIYLGDHPLDMAGALAAGVPGIGITTGAHSDNDLLDAGATWSTDSLTTVVAALHK